MNVNQSLKYKLGKVQETREYKQYADHMLASSFILKSIIMRIPNLYHSDPYWDEIGNIWRRQVDGRYDDEANDTRPENEKYSNTIIYLIFIAFLILLTTTIFLFRAL